MFHQFHVFIKSYGYILTHSRKVDNKKFDLKKALFEDVVKVKKFATSEGKTIADLDSEITATQIANAIQVISEVIVG